MMWILILFFRINQLESFYSDFKHEYRHFPFGILRNTCHKRDFKTIPVLIFHGANDWCPGIDYFTDTLQEYVNSDVICLEYGIKLDGIFSNLNESTNTICKMLENLRPILENGFNLIGLSMGGLLARSAVQICPLGDKVRNLITLGTPHMGVAKIPSHTDNNTPLIRILNLVYQKIVYTSLIQKFVSPTNFFKIKENQSESQEANLFLVMLNNEAKYNDTYRDRVLNLESFVSVYYSEERYLYPKETVMWGFMDEKPPFRHLNLTETKGYRQDSIGIKTLNESGRLVFIEAKGRHQNPEYAFSDDFKKLIYYCY